MREATLTAGWDGAWFRRAYDANGNPVGTNEDSEGKIYIEPQGMCVMAGIGRDDGKAQQALKSVKARQTCETRTAIHAPTNITYRIAFNGATGIDSRVIIDQMGAEKLTGLGDMLFSKVDWGKPRRIQGCFVSDDEINEIVEFVKSQSEPDYHEEILSAVAPASMSMAGGGGIVRTGVAEPQDDDPLIWEAAHIVVESQLGSTSGLQRRLKVGYARAGRIMDMLEEKGVVGPPDGSKPREVLLDEEGLAALESVDAEMAREDREFGGF